MADRRPDAAEAGIVETLRERLAELKDLEDRRVSTPDILEELVDI
jgi:hypothetical protein